MFAKIIRQMMIKQLKAKHLNLEIIKDNFTLVFPNIATQDQSLLARVLKLAKTSTLAEQRNKWNEQK